VVDSPNPRIGEDDVGAVFQEDPVRHLVGNLPDRRFIGVGREIDVEAEETQFVAVLPVNEIGAGERAGRIGVAEDSRGMKSFDGDVVAFQHEERGDRLAFPAGDGAELRRVDFDLRFG